MIMATSLVSVGPCRANRIRISPPMYQYFKREI
jgi:hypothetical protein